MKESICGANCDECPSQKICKGCAETGGCPFGKQCFVARYIQTGGMEAWKAFKAGLISVINALQIDGMETVTELYPLLGNFVNLAYLLPSGERVKFLDNNEMYLGAQVSARFDDTHKTCYGVIAREHFLLVCTYMENCEDPMLILYQRR